MHMTMIKILTLFAFAFMPFTANALPITTEKAKENAMTFLMSGNMKRMKGIRSLKLAFTHNDTKGVAAPLFHVFNINDGKGFVIASADDVAVPVLGYSENGAFDINNIPINMKEWLEGYGEEIRKARENGVVPKGNAPVHASRQKINPMIKSTWDQGAPYNNMCYFNGLPCWTGCVATAMAQIMYYWATTGIDGKKYRCGSTVLPEYTTVTRGFTVGALDALTSFDWDSMTDGEPTTEKGRTAIAQLMRYCGQSVQMDYDMGISGSYLERAAIALQKNFDYNWSLQVSNSEGKTEEEWQALVYNELNEGKPFVMAGFGFDCGHAFICDGYDPSTGEFHFNWGWSGDYDGWFAMTSLRPGEDDFSAGRQGIKGLQPFSNDHYAILSTDSKTLSFYCDDKRKERAGSPYILYGHMSYPDWYINTEDVEHVIFDSSFSEARPIYTANWFSRMEQLKDITGLNYLNTSEVIDMHSMFWGCESLDSIDMSHFDTPKVEKMNHMFCGCSNLRSLDLSHFDTSRVTDMTSMFYNCSSLTSIDMSQFNTSNVSSFNWMFCGCSNLRSLDLSHFDTSRVFSMSSMFYNCSSLTSLDVSHFNTSKVKYMLNMFQGCSSLEELDLSNFVINDKANRYYFNDEEIINPCYTDNMLYGCSNLKRLKISFSMNLLEDDVSQGPACYGVGAKYNPCIIIAPSDFNFGSETDSPYFVWKSGYFRLPDSYAWGDVNHDGCVNIMDVTMTVDNVLGKDSDDFHIKNADFEEDNNISIKDVINIVNIILGRE